MSNIKSVVCPDCGEPLKYDETLEIWGKGKARLNLSYLGHCPKCKNEFCWDAIYELTENEEVCPA